MVGKIILSCVKSVILRPVLVQSAFCIILRVFIALKFEESFIEWAQDGKHVYVVLRENICTLTGKNDLMVSQLLGLEPKTTQ